MNCMVGPGSTTVWLNGRFEVVNLVINMSEFSKRFNYAYGKGKILFFLMCQNGIVTWILMIV